MQKIIIILLSLTLTACATTKLTDPENDPWEPLNRKIFGFNLCVDRIIFVPIAKCYDALPGPIVCGIGNFFDNIDDVTNVANNILQLNFYDAWSDLWRIGFNTTFGILGLIDVASCVGLEKHHQDFGLTLAYWGMTKAPYIMVPIFGPTTIRDAIGWSVDWAYLSVWPYIEPTSVRYSLYALRLVHKRACLLPADKLIHDALDPYIFVRDAYIQKRDGEIKQVRGCWAKTAVETSEAKKNDDDTFIAEDDSKAATHKQDDDPFVEETQSQGKADLKVFKPSGDDTFVEP